MNEPHFQWNGSLWTIKVFKRTKQHLSELEVLKTVQCCFYNNNGDIIMYIWHIKTWHTHTCPLKYSIQFISLAPDHNIKSSQATLHCADYYNITIYRIKQLSPAHYTNLIHSKSVSVGSLSNIKFPAGYWKSNMGKLEGPQPNESMWTKAAEEGGRLVLGAPTQPGVCSDA